MNNPFDQFLQLFTEGIAKLRGGFLTERLWQKQPSFSSYSDYLSCYFDLDKLEQLFDYSWGSRKRLSATALERSLQQNTKSSVFFKADPSFVNGFLRDMRPAFQNAVEQLRIEEHSRNKNRGHQPRRTIRKVGRKFSPFTQVVQEYPDKRYKEIASILDRRGLKPSKTWQEQGINTFKQGVKQEPDFRQSLQDRISKARRSTKGNRTTRTRALNFSD